MSCCDRSPSLPTASGGLRKRLAALLKTRELWLTAATGVLAAAAWLTAGAGQTVSAVLALIAVATGGGPIIIGAVRGVLRRQVNVDELISIAVVASVGVGEYLPAAVVVWIAALGGLLEQFTAQGAQQAIDQLGSLFPQMAVVRENGQEREVKASEVKARDLVLLRPGSRIPVDGIVAKGRASVNEAPVTGEPMPKEKGPGDTVYAGTVVESGSIEVRAQRVGEDSTLGRMADLIRRAAAEKAPVERVADRYAKYITPATVALALLIYALTGEVMRAVTVLIVVCPCALILATPTAVVAAFGNAARNGVVIKSGPGLEALGSVTVVALDKTGTLTYGRPVIREVVALNGETEEELVLVAAIAEKFSEHPVARALVEEAERRGLDTPDPDEFTSVAGHGVSVVWDGHRVAVGTPELIISGGWEINHDTQALYDELQGTGATVVIVAKCYRVMGVIVVEDQIRETGPEVVAGLARVGIRRVMLLSGDNQANAQRVGRRLGVTEARGGLLPDAKVEVVRSLENAGERVAMVGDGINDAPALAAATVGVAMGTSGTQLAIESAQVALMTEDMSRLPYALALGQKALRLIGQNIWWSLLFNVGGLIGAAAGVLSPISGALVHNFGSVFVVVNAARLLRHRVKV